MRMCDTCQKLGPYSSMYPQHKTKNEAAINISICDTIKGNESHVGNIQFWVFNINHLSINPFLSVHIPYVQSEGILPQIRLLQWRAYIFRNTQCFSTKLGKNMVNALFCHKPLKYWWPLTYIQGHVIQDGYQIQSEKSILGQKIAITRPFFWQIW